MQHPELINAHGDYIVGGVLALETKGRWQIPNWSRDQLSPIIMQRAQEGVNSRHLGVEKRSLNSTYNCMGMVFGNRRCCIDPSDIRNIFEGDGYRRLTSEAEAVEGDVIVYTEKDGMVAQTPLFGPGGQRIIRVLSQWGAAGEYWHDIADVDVALGNPTEFWTDRKP